MQLCNHCNRAVEMANIGGKIVEVYEDTGFPHDCSPPPLKVPEKLHVKSGRFDFGSGPVSVTELDETRSKLNEIIDFLKNHIAHLESYNFRPLTEKEKRDV